VPQLTGRRLWSERLGDICVLLWNIALMVGVVGLLTAHTQSREYAEFTWGVDPGSVRWFERNRRSLNKAFRVRVVGLP